MIILIIIIRLSFSVVLGRRTCESSHLAEEMIVTERSLDIAEILGFDGEEPSATVSGVEVPVISLPGANETEEYPQELAIEVQMVLPVGMSCA